METLNKLADQQQSLRDEIKSVAKPPSEAVVDQISTSDQKALTTTVLRGSSAMPLVSPQLKEALDNFEQDFQAANLLEGKFIKVPPLTSKLYKLGQSCFKDKLQ